MTASIGAPASTHDLDDARLATPFVDADHPDVRAFARNATADATSADDAALLLFTAVRDEIRYDPYVLDLRPDSMRASAVLASGRNWCVPKATLLAAACRAVEVPAVVGFADVRNHLTTDRLDDLLGTDVFAWHGYTAIHTSTGWHKTTPAFNAELCAMFGVEPLDWDGTTDALLHAHDGRGRRHMEYLQDRGTWLELPLDTLAADLVARYPRLAGDRHAVASVHDPGFHGDRSHG